MSASIQLLYQLPPTLNQKISAVFAEKLTLNSSMLKQKESVEFTLQIWACTKSMMTTVKNHFKELLRT